MGGGTTRDVIRPVSKETLSDRLARQIRTLIQQGDYRQGDRLPTILEMARQFGVGHPTIREALKKLETMRVVEIRHGAGVYVTRSEDVLVLASPDYAGTVTKKLLLDLIRTRMLLEMQSVGDAVVHATPEQLREMKRLVATAEQNLGNDDVLSVVNVAFHRQIAQSSGNMVLAQLLDVLHDLFIEEQRLILGIHGSRERDHEEHLGILQALERRDEDVAVERMTKHLQGVHDAIVRWDPEDHPVA